VIPVKYALPVSVAPVKHALSVFTTLIFLVYYWSVKQDLNDVNDTGDACFTGVTNLKHHNYQKTH
jgi:hypothetical protein